MQKPTILECTLRDGSYEIDFQFTKKDTQVISNALDNSGFELIEVGHGVGLGATDKKIGIAAESDEVYMQAASKAVNTGKWGMFAIPGIAELQHLDLAKNYDMDFVRIGCTIEGLSNCKSFLEKALEYGITPYVNFMKSYAVHPEALAKSASVAFDMGAEAVYVVDSAGGMLPKEVQEYIQAIISENSQAKVGFHGHNNLGLGIGNALAAMEAGAMIIDTSLQGFGRSAGNTSTEQFLGCLARMGLEGNIDPLKVMDVGEDLIKPLIEKQGITSIDTISGMSLFHSSYMPLIYEAAKRYNVDPRLLIVSVCSEDLINASAEMVQKHAQKLTSSKEGKPWKPVYKNYFINEQANL
ncbi:hypothetical protein [Pseudoalteromonas sp. MTN2-4]|uniref:hypothetical protein n=1 Tax=Pseudoalteromonas sp. MTN2-4 TaxID=3056555 RepID=UPI0036F29B25